MRHHRPVVGIAILAVAENVAEVARHLPRPHLPHLTALDGILVPWGLTEE